MKLPVVELSVLVLLLASYCDGNRHRHKKIKEHHKDVAASSRNEIPDECQVKADLLVLVDASASINHGRYNYFQTRVKKLVKMIFHAFPISSTETHVSLVVFSSQTQVVSPFGQAKSYKEAAAAVDQMPYMRRLTDTGGAFKKSYDEFITHGRNDSNIGKVLLLITDGMPQNHVRALSEAESLKKNKIVIVTLGINIVRQDQIERLQSWATSPELYIKAGFNNLEKQLAPIKQSLCVAVVTSTRVQKLRPQADPATATPTNKKYDLLILIDCTISIENLGGADYFKSVYIPFIISYIEKFTISEQYTHICIWAYGDRASKRIISFEQFSIAEIRSALMSFEFPKYKQRNIGDALEFSNQNIAEGGRIDNDVGKSVLLITDGRSTDSIRSISFYKDQLKMRGCYVTVFGIMTRGMIRTQLMTMASRSEWVLTSTFQMMKTSSNSIIQSLVKNTIAASEKSMEWIAINAPGKDLDYVSIFGANSYISTSLIVPPMMWSDVIQKGIEMRADIVLLLDCAFTSAEIGFDKQTYFENTIKKFLIRFVRSYRVGYKYTMFSIILFGDNQQVITQFNLMDYYGVVYQLKNLNLVNYRKRNTGAALRVALDTINTYAQSGSSKLIYLITNGNADDGANVNTQINLCKQFGITITVMGIGNTFDVSTLRSYASDPSYYMSYGYDEFSNKRKRIVQQIQIVVTKTQGISTPNKPVRYRNQPVPPTIPRIPANGCNADADIFIIIDESNSVGQINFNQKMRMFVLQLTQLYAIHPKKTRFAVIRYGETQKVDFRFTTYVHSSQVQQSIRRMRYEDRGFSYIGRALKRVKEVFDQDQRSDTNYKKAVFLLADGASTNNFDAIEATAAADELKSENVVIATIGIGKMINEESFRSLATNASYYSHVQDYNELVRSVKTINDASSKGIEVTSTPPTPVQSPPLLMQPSATNKKIDLLILLDCTVSIENLAGPGYFKNAYLPFVISFIEKFTISKDYTRVAIWAYGDKSSMKVAGFQFSMEQIKTELNSLEFPRFKQRNTGEALKFAKQFFAEESRVDKDVGKSVLLITDGKSTDGSRTFNTYRDELTKRGYYVTVLGIMARGMVKNQVVRWGSRKEWVVTTSFRSIKQSSGTVVNSVVQNSVSASEKSKEWIAKNGPGKGIEVRSDILLLVDCAFTRAEVGNKNEYFESKIKTFLKEFIKGYRVGYQYTMFSVVLFGDSQQIITKFDSTDYFDVIERIKTARLPNYTTRKTGAGFGVALDTISKYGQSGSSKIIFLITNGNAKDPAVVENKLILCKQFGITINVMGIGNTLDVSTIRSYASDSSYFTSYGYRDFYIRTKTIIQQTQIVIRTTQGFSPPNHPVRNPTQKIPPTIPKVPTKGCDAKADIFILIDESTSVGQTNFNHRMRTFITQITQLYAVHPLKTRFAVIRYGEVEEVDFRFSECVKLSQVQQSIRRMRYQDKGFSYIGRALQRVKEIMDQDERPDKDYKKAVFLISDGASTNDFDSDKATAAANELKTNGVTIATLGIGKMLNEDSLKSLATNPAYYTHVENYNQLVRVTQKINQVLCNGVKVGNTPPETPITLPTPKVTAPNVITTPIAATDCSLIADIVVLVDSSGSITSKVFHKDVKDIAKKFVSYFDIGADKVRISYIAFSGWVRVVNQLSESTSKEALEKKISDMPFMGRKTRTDMAFRKAIEILDTQARPKASKMVLLLTDGNATYPIVANRAASAVKSKNYLLMAIGVGKMNKEQMKSSISPWVSDESYYFSADSYSELSQRIESIAEKVCTAVKVPPTTPSQPKLPEALPTKPGVLASPTDPVVTTKPPPIVANPSGSSTEKPIGVAGVTTPSQSVSTLETTKAPTPVINTALTTPSSSTTPGCRDVADIVILVDSSRSIGQNLFENKVKSILKEFVSAFDIRPSAVRISIITFSRKTKIEVHFSDSKSNDAIVTGISRLSYMDKDTYTHIAFNEAEKMLDTEARPKASKIVLLLTDGMPTKEDETFQAATALKAKSYVLMAIGVGKVKKVIMDKKIRDWVTDKSYYFSADSFTELGEKIKSITEKICTVAKLPPPTPGKPFISKVTTVKPGLSTKPTPSSSTIQPSPGVIPSLAQPTDAPTSKPTSIPSTPGTKVGTLSPIIPKQTTEKPKVSPVVTKTPTSGSPLGPSTPSTDFPINNAPPEGPTEGITFPGSPTTVSGLTSKSTTAPGQTTGKPGLPTDKPVLPSGKPRLPTDKPGLPTGKPGMPTDKPSLPSGKPGLPTDKPGLPTGKPGLPTGKPGLPTDKPSLPSNKPGLPTSKPGLPTDKPGLPTDKPGLPTDKPGLPTDTPVLPTDQPGLPTDKPHPSPSAEFTTSVVPNQNENPVVTPTISAGKTTPIINKQTTDIPSTVGELPTKSVTPGKPINPSSPGKPNNPLNPTINPETTSKPIIPNNTPTPVIPGDKPSSGVTTKRPEEPKKPETPINPGDKPESPEDKPTISVTQAVPPPTQPPVTPKLPGKPNVPTVPTSAPNIPILPSPNTPQNGPGDESPPHSPPKPNGNPPFYNVPGGKMPKWPCQVCQGNTHCCPGVYICCIGMPGCCPPGKPKTIPGAPKRKSRQNN